MERDVDTEIAVESYPRKMSICVPLITVVALGFAVERPVSAGTRSCRGVDVTPREDLQRLIEQRPPRTTFCLARGTYTLSRTISTGRKFPTLDLRSGAIIDGQNGDFIGITGSGAPARRRGTTILGGVFQHFGNAEAPLWASPLIVADSWIVKGTEFSDNFHTGLLIQGSHARVSNVHAHHNGRYGIAVTPPCVDCQSPRGVVIQNSEIAFNNTRRLSTIDAGGTKFCCGTIGMVVRGNEVHDNFGSGLWWDTISQDAKVYNNMIYDNRNWGIFWEASYGGAKIHDNTLINNGVGDGTIDWGANVQLLVSNSDGSIGGGIEIYENRISGTAIPIGLLNHTEGMPGTTQVYIHHNVMALRANSTLVGGNIFFGDPGLFSPEANNRFEHNAYRVRDRGASYWMWSGQTLTWREWQAIGHDNEGSLHLLRC